MSSEEAVRNTGALEDIADLFDVMSSEAWFPADNVGGGQDQSLAANPASDGAGSPATSSSRRDAPADDPATDEWASTIAALSGASASLTHSFRSIEVSDGDTSSSSGPGAAGMSAYIGSGPGNVPVAGDWLNAGAGAFGSNDWYEASPVGTVAKSGNIYIDAVLYGDPLSVRWTGVVTYDFPDSFADYAAPYAHTIGGFQQVTFEQRTAVRSILGDNFAALGSNGFTYGSVASFTNLSFTDQNIFGEADISVAETDTFDGANLGTARVADFPRDDERSDGGDVWFGNDYAGTIYDYRNPVIGNYAWATTIHELGHALGLAHTHNNGGGTATMPADRDGMEFTIMSYRSYIGAPLTGYPNEQWGFAQTFMMMDIQALQYLYGADFGTNSGNTTYTWSTTTGQMFINGVGQGTPGANRVFLTIWDGGGTDTYDMSNYSGGVNIDLTPGGWSITSAAQRAHLGNGNFARANVFNALLYQGNTASLIENAIGGSGADIIRGNQVANVLTGAGGNDELYGGGGNDTLNGGSLRDMLYGEDGNDTIYGGSGNDHIDGGSGTDALYGEGGNDTLIQNFGGPNELMDGGAGNDTGDWSYSTSDNWIISLVAGTAAIGATVYANLVSIENVVGGQLADEIIGDAGANVLDGQGGNDTISGAGGNDILRGGLGNDVLNGGSLADELFGEAGHDQLNGGSGNDMLDGGSLNDTLRGDGGNDTLYGRGGNDFLDGGAGADTMFGGDGSDTYYLDNGGDIVDETGTDGNDTIRSIHTLSLADTVRVKGDVENLTLLGAAAINGTGNGLANVLTGNSAANNLYGGSGSDSLIGEGGNDRLEGESGNDYLNGGIGDDVLLGGNSNDTLYGEGGADWLLGGNGIDYLNGGSLNDLLDGGAGHDTLIGGSGHDTLVGGADDDYMAGGADSDTYYVDHAGDIVDETGTNGNDLVYSHISFDMSDGVHALGDIENLTLLGAAAINGTGNGLANTITGNSGDNILSGLSGNDIISGLGGNDTLYGGSFHDILNGGEGDDIILAGSGNDTLKGAGGQDDLTGGDGADTFMFSDISESTPLSAGRDIITDFDGSEGDIINLSQIDANGGLAGNGAFSFIGAAAFTNVAGQLRYEVISGNTFVFGDVNGDGAADLGIRLNGIIALNTGDFML